MKKKKKKKGEKKTQIAICLLRWTPLCRFVVCQSGAELH